MQEGEELTSSSYLTNIIWQLLDNCLEMGITEVDFWNSTLAELERAAAAKQRIKEQEMKEKAYFDYMLANLIGVSISRLYDSNAKMPPLEDAYNTIFENENDEPQISIEEKQDQINYYRFKQFAQNLNNNFDNKEVGKKDE